MGFPLDGYMLLSYVNTLLRDKYASFSKLCEEEDGDEGEILNKLSALGYEYDAASNSFKAV